VLDLSRIEAGQLEVRFAPFNLSEAVSRVAESIRPLAEKKGLSLAVTLPLEPIEVTSDRRRTEQILINLLNNAVKFTDRGGVQMVVETASLTGDGSFARPAVRMRVIDTGPGISAEELATLFQPFRQLEDGLTRQHDGTGLGLAICRRLTTLLGGELSVNSSVAHGSEFATILPVTPAR
jgi:signal transduction histidine kinase